MAGLRNVDYIPLLATAPAVTSSVFCLYQLQFAAITPAIIFGSVAERYSFEAGFCLVLMCGGFGGGPDYRPQSNLSPTPFRMRLVPAIIFIFVWSTLVYDVIAYWNWSHVSAMW